MQNTPPQPMLAKPATYKLLRTIKRDELAWAFIFDNLYPYSIEEEVPDKYFYICWLIYWLTVPFPECHIEQKIPNP